MHAIWNIDKYESIYNFVKVAAFKTTPNELDWEQQCYKRPVASQMPGPPPPYPGTM